MTTERDSFNSIIPSMPLAPDLENEQFATYGPYGHQLPNGRQLESEYPRGNYNSGEDIQSIIYGRSRLVPFCKQCERQK